MFYVWQMNDGRWHVDAFTLAPMSAKRMARQCPGFETRAEAEAWKRDAVAAWADVHEAARRLAPPMMPVPGWTGHPQT